jgi:hypothetical protein
MTILVSAWLIPALSPAAAAEPDQLLARITADAGATDRVDTPVSVVLPETINPWRQMRLAEVTPSGRTPVPLQVEPGAPPKLWWVLAGTTPAKATRTFELLRGNPVAGDAVCLTLTGQTLDVSFKDAPLFSYNHAHVIPPDNVRPQFIRSGYIHPMYSPGGQLVTEDFPGDHHHHKGVWLPWTKTEFEGRQIDFWNLGGEKGTVQFAGFDGLENGPVYGRFTANHQHVDVTQPNGGTVVLAETWDVRVWAVGGRAAGYWVWDLTSTQTCVAKNPLHLKKYRYGGLGYRGAKEWKGDNYHLLTSEGHTKKDGHTKTSKWCAHSGAVDGQDATVVVMCHPANERFPEPMRIWASGGAFFNYTPIQRADWDFEPGETHVFRYRFFIHQGAIDAKRAEEAWLDFGEPPSARLTVAD